MALDLAVRSKTIVLTAGANPVAITGAKSTATFLSTPNGAGHDPDRGHDRRRPRNTTGRQANSARSTRRLPGDCDRAGAGWISRMTLNVGRVTAGWRQGGNWPKPVMGRCAGAGDAGAVDRCVAGSRRRHLLQEWSGLFCRQGEQGDAVLLLPARQDDGRAWRRRSFL